MLLLLSRAAGEVVLIGESQLVVRQVQPSVRLQSLNQGVVEEFEFAFERPT